MSEPHPAVPGVPLPPTFVLVGTGINGAKAFAIVRNGDGTMVTVHRGDTIAAYTVRAIRADRIELRAASGRSEVVVLGRAPLRADAPPIGAGPARTVEAAINTDQSIPEHVTYGPTGTWTDGKKHVH